MLSIFQIVQISHAFNWEWDRYSTTIGRVQSDRDSARKERDNFKSQLEATTSELSELKLIAQDKEKKLLSEQEKTKKVEEEVSFLRGLWSPCPLRWLS